MYGILMLYVKVVLFHLYDHSQDYGMEKMC